MPQAIPARVCKPPDTSCRHGRQARRLLEARPAECRERARAVRPAGRPVRRQTQETHARIWTNRWAPTGPIECAVVLLNAANKAAAGSQLVTRVPVLS